MKIRIPPKHPVTFFGFGSGPHYGRVDRTRENFFGVKLDSRRVIMLYFVDEGLTWARGWKNDAVDQLLADRAAKALSA